ncbi:hypothetical protein EDD16DRAFT_1847646 [Pisolithus croceorrhizus]|nr:hypothetical protein EDD16DRAFT_1847646 [Pisolithus croceorrhizus]KAI6130128.1 hypothetical protein EV401DRAFT_2126684 [Pisolithus croceorrhizus]
MSLLSPPSTNSTPLSHYHSLTPSPAILTSPLGTPSPASSSSVSISLTAEDEENVTITASRSLAPKQNGRRKSQEDIRLLAILTHITELSYSLSDIQTRIFEIQELRHKPQTDGGVDATVTAEIDNALMSMTDRLEAIDRGLKTVNESIAPYQPAGGGQLGETSELTVVLRKHAALLREWDAVQQETEELQQELKEDKWITVFRTVTEQADGMMASLEKAVNKCQDFIRQVYKRGGESASRLSCSSLRSEKSPISLETFNTLLGSFNAKKEHYVPATTKVLAIMDNGVRNRVTKNGEALRRHTEAAKRWRLLQERMDRVEREMENVRKILVSADQALSEAGSSSGNTANGYLATPPSGSLKGSRTSSRTSKGTTERSSLSRSMSPLKKLAKRLTGSMKSPASPPDSLPVSRASSQSLQSQTPLEPPEKIIRRQRSSLFTFGSKGAPLTPDTKGHKYSQSLTPESSPASKRPDALDANVTIKQKSSKQPWNASTKVESEALATVKPTPSKRPTAKSVISSDRPPLVAPCTPSHRSLSRSSNSNASSRPWSPVTSSISTAPSSNPSIPSLPIPYRPPSRAQTPGLGTTPRPRPRTPSGIPVPAPSQHGRSVSARHPGADDDTDEAELTLMQRAFSPALTQSTSSPGTRSALRSGTPSGSRVPPPRPPSRSRIPLPSVHVSSESRPSSTLSFYRPESPLDASRITGLSFRAQTPESTLKTRAQQVPVFTGARPTARPSLPGWKVPPSSYRDASSTRTPSRPGSRAGAHTPNLDSHQVYVPSNPKDPLDAEVAAVVNSIPHGLLIERVDPPLKSIPKEGEEIRASYAFSNSLARKVVTCRLTTLTRSGSRTSGETTTKKVMCRVGGGWQDLQLYMLNRQAGL